MLTRTTHLAAAVCFVCLAAAAPAAAQESLQEALAFLMTNQSIPTGDFEKDAEAARITSDAVSRLLLAELTTLPLSSASAGFVYRLNPALGTIERASEGFGPFFTDRSFTVGRGQASVGVSFRMSSFSAIDGYDLDDGTFVTTANQFSDEPAPFDVEALDLDLDSRTLTFAGDYGITEWMDIGLAIPIVTVSFDGTRVNTYRGTSLIQATATGDANGLGDVALRTKVRLVEASNAGMAVLGEVRLPTGREEDLLGAGETAFRTMAIVSVEPGRLAAHFNVGAGWGGVADELHYRAALGVSVTPRVTIVGEALGRRLSGLGQLIEEIAPHPEIEGVNTLRLVTNGESTHTSSALVGVKWNVAGTWLLNGSLSIPLTDRGLKPAATLLVGIDYAFEL